MVGSWKTKITGYIMIGAGILGLIAEAIAKQGIPDTIMEWFTFGSLIAGGIVALLAKDFDVSNAPHPVASAIVSTASAEKVNPSAPVIKSIGIMFLIALFGTGLTACETLKHLGGETQNQLEAVIAVTAAGMYDVSYVVKRNGLTMLAGTIVYECTQSDGKLTGCHKRNPAPAAVVP